MPFLGWKRFYYKPPSLPKSPKHKNTKSPTNPPNPRALKGIRKKVRITPQKKNAYSPNALTTSNRIPAKADLQSPSHATLRLGAPLLFPAHLGRSRGFESLPVVFR